MAPYGWWMPLYGNCHRPLSIISFGKLQRRYVLYIDSYHCSFSRLRKAVAVPQKVTPLIPRHLLTPEAQERWVASLPALGWAFNPVFQGLTLCLLPVFCRGVKEVEKGICSRGTSYSQDVQMQQQIVLGESALSGTLGILPVIVIGNRSQKLPQVEIKMIWLWAEWAK